MLQNILSRIFCEIKCENHTGQACCLFCQTCKTFICVKCVAKVHNGHELIEEEDYNEGKVEMKPKQQVNPDYLLPFAGTSEDFSKLLSTGTYESFENRVFLCGSCACGKSTLASVLIGTPIPRTWESTNGLVIHFGRNGINLETNEMVPLTGGNVVQHWITMKYG
ncbi:unnamed protein product [Mytilus edulis]|uniref:B box-type domain-containing protein n=1 Tax=Mytilus edulis TaxID=6550 RepID=A0A8S3U930_MYTED|nr:unnamed protein product [Mytilus edulis]